MPLHFESFTNDCGNPEILANIVGPVFDKTSSAFASPDKLHFMGRSDMIDSNTGSVIGQYVFTIFANNEAQCNELLDIDIVLTNHTATPLHFLELLPGSSDANEYYEAETADTEQHLEIETVNRYTVSGDLVDTTHCAYLSVFPFELSVYKDVDEFNEKLGFHKIRPMEELGFTTVGLSETFISPGRVFAADGSDDHCSFLLGTVESFRDVSISVGSLQYDFVLAQVKTALGTVPVAMGRAVFDLKTMRVGSFVAMRAYIKADLSKPEDWLS